MENGVKPRPSVLLKQGLAFTATRRGKGDVWHVIVSRGGYRVKRKRIFGWEAVERFVLGVPA